jgi:3,4-dihydroxy 2-butanone 4-phosphate synthase/GTP cyclohydrolase II
MPTRFGDFQIYGYRETHSGMDHVALVYGGLPIASPTLVRIHSECLTGESFGSLRCDCRAQLDLALERIAAAKNGVVVYMRGHEGRGIGLINKIRAYGLQDAGRDTAGANSELGLPIDARDYTNNPEKIRAAERAGLTITERVPVVGEVTHDNERYLRTKALKFGHLLPDL